MTPQVMTFDEWFQREVEFGRCHPDDRGVCLAAWEQSSRPPVSSTDPSGAAAVTANAVPPHLASDGSGDAKDDATVECPDCGGEGRTVQPLGCGCCSDWAMCETCQWTGRIAKGD